MVSIKYAELYFSFFSGPNSRGLSSFIKHLKGVPNKMSRMHLILTSLDYNCPKIAQIN